MKIVENKSVSAEAINTFCLGAAEAIGSCKDAINGISYGGDLQRLNERLIALSAMMTETALLGKKCSAVLDKRSQVATMYDNLSIRK